MKVVEENVKNLKFVTINNDNGFSVTLCSLGASIFAIHYLDKCLTLNYANKDEYMLDDYHGRTIGRVCNRLPGNSININGVTYQIENNEGPNTLHGGLNGVSSKDFGYEISENNGEITVKFTYLSKNMESGFPGNMLFEITYIVTNDNTLEIKFSATTDEDTMCSLTNHAYYSLGSSSLDDLELSIKGSKFLHPNEKDLLPVEIREVNEIMDFRNYKKIVKYIEDSYLINSRSFGYDHFYYFDQIDPNRINVSLRNEDFVMNIQTDFGGVQIYTDNYEDEVKYESSNLKRRRGIAIEPSDSQKDLHFLKKGEKYNRFIKYSFERR